MLILGIMYISIFVFNGFHVYSFPCIQFYYSILLIESQGMLQLSKVNDPNREVVSTIGILPIPEHSQRKVV